MGSARFTVAGRVSGYSKHVSKSGNEYGKGAIVTDDGARYEVVAFDPGVLHALDSVADGDAVVCTGYIRPKPAHPSFDNRYGRYDLILQSVGAFGGASAAESKTDVAEDEDPFA